MFDNSNETHFVNYIISIDFYFYIFLTFMKGILIQMQSLENLFKFLINGIMPACLL